MAGSLARLLGGDDAARRTAAHGPGLWLEEIFYFATDQQSQKARNLAADSELVAALESGDEVVILEGTAKEVADPSLLARLADALEMKYDRRPKLGVPRWCPAPSRGV